MELVYDSKDEENHINYYHPKSLYIPSMKFEHHGWDALDKGQYSWWMITMGDGTRYFYGGDYGIEKSTQKSPEYEEICNYLTNDNEGNKLPPAVASCLNGSVELGVRLGRLDWPKL